jgi:phenylalanyl-tRNA synthetase alpha chain
LHEYEIAALKLLKKEKKLGLEELEKGLGIERDKLLWAIENLKSGGLVEVDKKEKAKNTLTKEGLGYLNSMPEEKLAGAAAEKPVKLDDKVDSVALSWAKRNGWVEIKDGRLVATPKWKAVSSKGYDQRAALKEITDGKTPDAELLLVLLKRGLVRSVVRLDSVAVKITAKGSAAELESGGIGAITRDVLVSGSWKREKIRPYDINAPYEKVNPARLHPLHEMINTIRSAWLSMGFVESAGPIVESSFWNFDALFSPQDHPTREMQDTFFLSNPKLLDVEDLELLDRVRTMHKKGWGQVFNDELSRQAVLRTHTTSVSIRGIHRFAKALEENYPLKLFCVGRVFRNETVDYKHLAEFYQTEGIVVGDNLSMSNLIDVLKKFYAQLGMEKVRFKPSYFPFTEPSLEVQYYDEGRGEEIEVGGAGIIREEITKAMGTDKTVLAWGLSVDRLMMQKLGIDRITELYKNDIGWLRNRPPLKV